LEIEAKFRIPGEQAFEHLLQMATLAHFRLGQVSLAELHDQYLDTAGGAMQAAGLACRLRRIGDSYLATLKGLGGASGAIHRRVEHQVALEAPLSPPDWPPSAARDLALRLCGNQPLLVLFEIEQMRHSRAVYRGDLAVAELSLDRVRFLLGDLEACTCLELEAELLAGGREKDLHQLVQELQTTWNLIPETQSKFERGLALWQNGLTADEGV
jgi:inorganic triphosphatase YgiF